jgi:hypothetical protein
MAFGLAGPLVAQQRNTPPLDSTQAAYRARLAALRDTVRPVSAAIAEFRRDLRAAGPETVTSKAERLVRACGAARSAVIEASPGVTGREAPVSTRAAGDSLRAALGDLAAALEEHCAIGLAPTGPGQRVDSLRAWGPYRASQLRMVIDRFNSELTRAATSAGFKLPRPSR